MKFAVKSNGVLVTTVSGTSIDLTGLTENTAYTVTVTPENGLDLGTSAKATFTTLSAAPNPNLWSLLEWLAKSTDTSSMHQLQYTLKPSTAYTVSTNYPDPSGGYYYDMWADKKSVALSSGVNPLSKSKARHITTGSDGIIVLGIRDGTTEDGVAAGTTWVKIEEGATATAWVAAVADRTVTIPATATSITVESYVDAIGTETNGLGTSTYGLGGSDPQTVTPTKVTTGANSTTVVLPIDYTPTGSITKHEDGAYYLITGNKTLRFTLK